MDDFSPEESNPVYPVGYLVDFVRAGKEESSFHFDKTRAEEVAVQRHGLIRICYAPPRVVPGPTVQQGVST
jgi:hypothetical protein